MAIFNLGGGGGEPELQSKTATPLITNAQQIIVPDTGYDGLSQVTVGPMPTGALKAPTVNSLGYVSSGVQTAGFLDTSAVSGLQLSTQAAKTITPATYSQTAVASGKYTTGAVTVKGDSNLVASNIVRGASIFGIAGAAETMMGFYDIVATGSGSRTLHYTLPESLPDNYYFSGLSLIITDTPDLPNASVAIMVPTDIGRRYGTPGAQASFQVMIQAYYNGYSFITDIVSISVSGTALYLNMDQTSNFLFGNGVKYSMNVIFLKE